MPDVDPSWQEAGFQDGATAVLARAKMLGEQDCANLGELHARFVQLVSREPDPETAAELLALEQEIGRIVDRLASRDATISRSR